MSITYVAVGNIGIADNAYGDHGVRVVYHYSYDPLGTRMNGIMLEMENDIQGSVSFKEYRRHDHFVTDYQSA